MSEGSVSFEGLSFSYRGAPETIHDVSLSVRAGECVVLCGPSGGGKTTLIRLVNGLAGAYYHGRVEGAASVNGLACENLASWQRAEQVGSVFQDPSSQFFSSQLAGEVAFGCENLGYPHEKVVGLTDQAIAAFDLDELRGCSNDRLSSGQKQKVAIASAIAPGPPVLAMDEPSSNLDEPAARALGATLLQLKAKGYTIVIAEHRLAYLMQVADRFCFVRAGRIERSAKPRELLGLAEGKLRAWGLRSPRPLERPCLPAPAAAAGAGEQAPALALSGLSVAHRGKRVVAGLSLCVYPGQIVALTGKNGAGKTSVLRVVAGLAKAGGGLLEVAGKKRSSRALRRLVWYSPNDVKAEFFTTSVQEEVLLLARRDEESRSRAERILRELGLWELRDRYPGTLSGGQKQRLSVACGLVTQRPVIALDEPTSGLDALSMERLARSLAFAADEGRAVLVATHDSEFLHSCCTHDCMLGPLDAGPDRAA